ncbi:hypothetical protein IVB33_29030 [Bradyrhizobium sp. 24]|uniref:hypothetical protein n=1 Tax=unclassified Bradyrhizobium TaxID=2631580 RepID=UPI001FF74058|nr:MULTISPECIES: hypothetical protein [unclassified Bradyrhizobium]MCK1302949.1 hypothetical protein [Bradyrhizobium sp. 37]MCK1380996.1 hypothetical protein [Bradyrhizobium sp. 24]MCK1772445.1 hypothetical protein [Bradyrhizobium sp. 134]
MTKRRAGRPSQNIIVPHPLNGDEWLQVGKYDKTWPAANRYWILVREGMSRAEALTKAADEFKVQEQSLSDWLRRARRRGPIGHFEGGPDDN